MMAFVPEKHGRKQSELLHVCAEDLSASETPTPPEIRPQGSLCEHTGKFGLSERF